MVQPSFGEWNVRSGEGIVRSNRKRSNKPYIVTYSGANGAAAVAFRWFAAQCNGASGDSHFGREGPYGCFTCDKLQCTKFPSRRDSPKLWILLSLWNLVPVVSVFHPSTGSDLLWVPGESHSLYHLGQTVLACKFMEVSCVHSHAPAMEGPIGSEPTSCSHLVPHISASWCAPLSGPNHAPPVAMVEIWTLWTIWTSDINRYHSISNSGRFSLPTTELLVPVLRLRPGMRLVLGFPTKPFWGPRLYNQHQAW